MELSKQPKIIWTKIKCPLCHEPTGDKSKCYDLEPAHSMPEFKKNYTHVKLGILPVFSTNCYWRSKNLWKFDVNYNLSTNFVNILQSVDGIEEISEIAPHSCVLAFGRLYDEKDVKKNISIMFKTYIKSLEVIKKPSEIKDLLIGIEFPNGKKFIAKEDNNLESQKNYLRILLDELPGTKAIFSKSLENFVAGE